MLSRMGLGRLTLGRLGSSLLASASAFSFANAEAEALVGRMTSEPDDTRKGLIDDLVGDLKAAGVWTLIDVLYVLAAHDEQAALLEWKGNTAYDAVKNGAPAFHVDSGFHGNSVAGNYLQTSYAPGTSSLGLTPTDAHNGAFIAIQSSTTGSTNSDLGMGTPYRVRGGDTTALLTLAGATVSITPPSGSAPQHLAASRTSTTSAFAYRNGVAGVEQVNSATTAPTVSLTLLTQAAASGGPDRRLSIAHVGRALTAQQHLDTFTAFNTYLTAVGAV